VRTDGRFVKIIDFDGRCLGVAVGTGVSGIQPVIDHDVVMFELTGSFIQESGHDGV
jgi:hypothetical protein